MTDENAACSTLHIDAVIFPEKPDQSRFPLGSYVTKVTRCSNPRVSSYLVSRLLSVRRRSGGLETCS